MPPRSGVKGGGGVSGGVLAEATLPSSSPCVRRTWISREARKIRLDEVFQSTVAITCRLDRASRHLYDPQDVNIRRHQHAATLAGSGTGAKGHAAQGLEKTLG
ncbi:unnamed protein product, partial [Phaeothamnion confervicola]